MTFSLWNTCKPVLGTKNFFGTKDIGMVHARYSDIKGGQGFMMEDYGK